MSTDVKEQVITEVQDSKYGFAIQLDKSTDESNCPQLLVYVRYATKDAIPNELLLINKMKTTTKGENVFELVDNVFKKKWSPMDQASWLQKQRRSGYAWQKIWVPSSGKSSVLICHFRSLLHTSNSSRC